MAEGARLHFQRRPAEMRCQACGASFALADSADFTCPACASADVRVTTGEEFYVESIDVET
jgi:hydrogenase nickel incorporation protein HypA/HybF